MTAGPIEDAPAQRGGGAPQSRQVAWFEVYAYADRLAAKSGVPFDDLPIAGTPRWCCMPDNDARKLLALVLGGVREAITHDVRQEALSDASREISQMADWSRISRGRGAAYIPRKAS